MRSNCLSRAIHLLINPCFLHLVINADIDSAIPAKVDPEDFFKAQ